MTRVRLSPAVRKKLQAPVRGRGGFQHFLHELQAHVEGHELVVDEELRGRIEHYAVDFGRGGWQTLFRQFARRGGERDCRVKRKRAPRPRRAVRLDYSQRLARGLPRLGSHLAIVVTLRLLTEFVLDRLIRAKSPTPKRILDDSRTFTYSAKLVLVRNMGLIDEPLFRNLDALRRLHNEYAHGLESISPRSSTSASSRGTGSRCSVASRRR